MLNIHKYEGKTKEEALNKCLLDLEADEEDLFIKEIDSEGSLFKSKKCSLEVITKVDIMNYIKDYFTGLSRYMGLDIKTEIRIIERIFVVKLISDNNNILIGKDGRILNAIQLILRQSIERQAGQTIKLNVDISNYKERKTKRLENEIKNIAEEILNSKIDVALDPMNSFDRRTVHCLISQYANLTTESIGEGPERHVVIKYVEQ